MDERITRYGARDSGKKTLEERRKREQRRHRTDKIRSGLKVMARVYRDILVGGGTWRPGDVADAVERLHEAMDALERSQRATPAEVAPLTAAVALTTTAERPIRTSVVDA